MTKEKKATQRPLDTKMILLIILLVISFFNGCNSCNASRKTSVLESKMYKMQTDIDSLTSLTHESRHYLKLEMQYQAGEIVEQVVIIEKEIDNKDLESSEIKKLIDSY